MWNKLLKLTFGRKKKVYKKAVNLEVKDRSIETIKTTVNTKVGVTGPTSRKFSISHLSKSGNARSGRSNNPEFVIPPEENPYSLVGLFW